MLYVGARRSLLKRRGNSTPIWTPAANFPLGTEPGLWYDPSSFTGLYQDSAGTSPATAVGQPNGLMLDKRLGLVLGPESLSNGDFSNGLAGWTAAGSTITLESQQMRVTNVSAFGQGYNNATGLTVGKSYKVSGAYWADAGNAPILRAPGISGAENTRLAGTSGVASFVFTAVSSTQNITLINTPATSGLSCLWDNISVKELPGNHISQATASARPLIGASGAIQYTTFDGLDDGMSTGAITLGSDMDCFIAVKRNNSAYGILVNSNGNNFFSCISNEAAAADSGVGASATYLVDGQSINGGLPGVTRAQLFAAVTPSAWHVLEVRNLSLASWTALAIGVFPPASAYTFGGNIAQFLVVPAGDAAARQKNRQWLGNKVGLVLP